FFVLLCDYYYFFFCVLAGCLVGVWETVRQRRLFFLKRADLTKYSLFFVVVLLSSGLVFLGVLRQQRKDPFSGAHTAEDFSLDLLAPFLPGARWRFASWTEFYWSRWTISDKAEGNVYLGLSALCLAALGWWRRARIPQGRVTLF